MKNKSYTILIASNRHGETFKFTLPASWLKALSFLGFCLILLGATAVIDYMGLLLTSNENKFLRAENSTLKQEFQVAEEKLSSLESSLERIQNFTKKLNLITNVEDDERILKLAQSPSSKPGGAIDIGAGSQAASLRANS